MITATFETITPETAKKYLEANIDNYRVLKPTVVESYARDMKAGLWQFNGEPILFKENGILLDGQHRLNAIIKSGCTIDLLVVRGIPNSTDIADWGNTRSTASVLKKRGITNSSMSCAIASIILYGFKKAAIAKGMVMDYVADNEEALSEAYSIIRTGSKNGMCKTAANGALALCLTVNGLATVDQLKDFFRIANTGNVVGYKGDPSAALVYRRQISYKGARGGGKSVQKETFEIAYKAIMDFCRGVTRVKNYDSSTDTGTKLIEKTKGKLI